MAVDVIEPLLKLQDLDSQLYRLRGELRQKPLELEQAKQRVAEQQASAKLVEDRVKGLQLKHKERELELSTKEGAVKKFQGQLFQVKTNKEYTAMQHEIDQSKADISLLEEQILGLLEQIDQAKQQLAGEQAVVTKEQEALRKEQARIDGELAAIKGQVGTLEQQRQGVTPVVEKESLSLYERVLHSREGLALVPLLKESCGGCHM